MELKLRRTLSAWKADGLIPDPSQDFDALARLNELARAERIPGGDIAEDYLDAPVECGGFLFYRLSFAASEWLDHVAGYFVDKPHTLLLCHAFASIYGRDKERLALARKRKALAKELRTLADDLTCSKDTVAATLDYLTGSRLLDAGTATGNPEGGAIGDAALRLTEIFGESPEYWICRAPLAVLEDALNQAAEQEHKRLELAAAVHGASVPPSLISRQRLAFMAYSREARALEAVLRGRTRPTPEAGVVG